MVPCGKFVCEHHPVSTGMLAIYALCSEYPVWSGDKLETHYLLCTEAQIVKVHLQHSGAAHQTLLCGLLNCDVPVSCAQYAQIHTMHCF